MSRLKAYIARLRIYSNLAAARFRLDTLNARLAAVLFIHLFLYYMFNMQFGLVCTMWHDTLQNRGITVMMNVAVHAMKNEKKICLLTVCLNMHHVLFHP